MREFVIPENAIEEVAGVNIATPPERVAAIYRDVETWGDTFPATIATARITRSGENWKEIEVEHKKEGWVANLLVDLSDTEIALEENKKNFSATFLNRFEPYAEGTHYVIQAFIQLKGIYKVLKPLIKGYVRRQAIKQMRSYVLEPLKIAAEKSAVHRPSIHASIQ